MSMEMDGTKHYATRMARKKSYIDARIAEAVTDLGVLLVLTGNGKGKSSSAFGMVARALGHHLKVGVVQFIKGRTDTGEESFFSSQPGIEWHVMGDGFTWETQDQHQDQKSAQAAWAVAQRLLRDSSLSLVVLDELTYAIKYGYLDIEMVVHDLGNRPAMQHVVVTGRNCPHALLDMAHTVTTMEASKHAFHAGIAAQKGIEW